MNFCFNTLPSDVTRTRYSTNLKDVINQLRARAFDINSQVQYKVTPKKNNNNINYEITAKILKKIYLIKN